MLIHQFINPNLSHFSYGILDESVSRVVLIDPSRNVVPYLEWAQLHNATIGAVIETHSHADFVSSHLEIHERTGATIYVSKNFNAQFPHQSFDGGDILKIGELEFCSLNTPGHSKDSICILLKRLGKDYGVFTGDTLFIGDCGRPDLRENEIDEINKKVTRQDQAKQLFHSLRDQLLGLDSGVIVYPAHGAGSLCGKALSDAKSSTIGAEKLGNWSLAEMSEQTFIETLVQDQPFVPQYFSHAVTMNRKGAPWLEKTYSNLANLYETGMSPDINPPTFIIDTRNQHSFNAGHFPYSINLMKGIAFSTWLGSIIKPRESFYLLTEEKREVEDLLIQLADIGYDPFVKGTMSLEGLSYPGLTEMVLDILDVELFKNHPDQFTILDIRNPSERRLRTIFPNSINIPLFELRDRFQDIPVNKPIVVHCAAGYRSAAGSSIIRLGLKTKFPVYDLGVTIKEFTH